MRSAHCALLSDRQPKIQPAIAIFSAGEFRQQPALSDNTGYNKRQIALREGLTLIYGIGI